MPTKNSHASSPPLRVSANGTGATDALSVAHESQAAHNLLISNTRGCKWALRHTWLMCDIKHLDPLAVSLECLPGCLDSPSRIERIVSPVALKSTTFLKQNS